MQSAFSLNIYFAEMDDLFSKKLKTPMTIFGENNAFVCRLEGTSDYVEKMMTLEMRVQYDHGAFLQRLNHDLAVEKVFAFMKSMTPAKTDESYGHYRAILEMGNAPIEERVINYITKCIGGANVRVGMRESRRFIVEIKTKDIVYVIESGYFDVTIDAFVHLACQLYYHLTDAHQDVKIAQ